MYRFTSLFLVATIAALSFTTLAAQNTTNCGCDYIINASLANGISFAPWRTGNYHLAPLPGQTICLTGNYADLRIDGIKGTANAPITIKNLCTSVATFNSTSTNPPFSLSNSEYVHITGAGNPSVNYGMTVNCSGSAGVSVTGTTVRNIEIDHVEVSKSGFAGFMIKQDPACESNTWRDSMTMYNIELHDNYVHDVAGEGFYLGNSFWQGGMTRTCGGQNIIVYPHRILGLKVHHNTIRNTGWDGLQYGCSPDAQVYNNLIENTGLLKVAQQMNGVQIGGGSGGLFYNNIIRNPGSTALALIGFVSTTKIYNNLIANAYEGIFADTRDSIKLPKIELDIYNNTLVNVSQNGLTIYDNGYQYKDAAGQWVFFTKGYQPRIKNNVIIGPYFDFRFIIRDPSIQVDSSKNYKLKTPFTSAFQYFVPQKLALFADTISYPLKSTSYLVNKGTNSVSNVLTDDILGVSRLQDAAFDIGAYEYVGAPFSAPQQSEKPLTSSIKDFSLYPSIVTDVLTINLPELSQPTDLVVYNMMGQPLSRRQLASSNSNQTLRLLIDDMPKGYYFCVLESDNKPLSSLKFTKQ